MTKLNCYIPSYLSAVSKFVLEVLEERLGLKIDARIDRRSNIKFEYDQNSFELPSYFIDVENEKFLKERNFFDFSLKNFNFDEIELLGMYPNNIKAKEAVKYDIDIVGTVFVLLSRYEEQVLNIKNFDYYNRLNPENAINYKYLDTPIVDELVRLFKKLLKKEFDLNLNPTVAEFKVLPSHDVDRPFEYLYYTKAHLLKRLGGDLLVRRSPNEALNRLKNFKKVKNGDLNSDPYNTFEWIMDQSEKYNRTSTFHFIAEATDPSYDQRYEIFNQEMKDLFVMINERGHKLALHPSFKSSEMNGQVKKEFERLLKACSELGISQHYFKSRYHYLRWNNNSVQELEKAGIHVDQTLTFAQKAGFRCGTSIPYKAFDFSSMKSSEIIIEPLILMENTLFSELYMGFDNNLYDAWNIVSVLKEQCKEHKGNFTILWHNNQLIKPEMKDFYQQCIK